MENTNNQTKKTSYPLNPDSAFVKELFAGLTANTKRYGYPICPCRLATGNKEEDKDVICPCDYREQDVAEYGTCYCGLYVSQKLIDEKGKIKPIPERRLSQEMRLKMAKGKENESNLTNLSYPIWRCQVCGYICARTEAPQVCPICGATHERFEILVK